MSLIKRLTYVALGAVASLALIFGIYSASAQTDSDSDAETETETIVPESGWGLFSGRGGRFDRGGWLGSETGDSTLAEALGITTDELEAAVESAYATALEQAVAEGLLTEEEAEALTTNPRFHHGLSFLGSEIDFDALLADALGISVEELQAAQETAFAARLTAMVEAGYLTEEQAALMQAYRSVEGYLDYDALNESVQSFYQAAVEQAVAEGAITQEQADQMLENLPNFSIRGLGRPFGFGGHERGHHGGPGGFRGFFQPSTPTTPEVSPSGVNA